MATKTKKQSDTVLAKQMAKAVQKELKKYTSLPEARYEAATVPYQTRSWLYEGVVDAKYDIDPYTRTELLRVSRYFEKNSWIVQRLISTWNQYVFGSNGLMVVPSTSLPTFNDLASDWWHNWAKFPDISSQQSLIALEHIMGRRWWTDGEIFIYKLNDPDTKLPKIQLIEAHRIQNPGTDMDPATKNHIVDGFELDEDTNKPIAIHIGEAYPGGYVGGYMGSYMNSGLTGTQTPNPYVGSLMKYKRITMDKIIHLYESDRAEQVRGISRMYSVLRDIQDLHELYKLENMAAKDLARTSAFITNATGQANPLGKRALQLRIHSQLPDGQYDKVPAPQFFEVANAGERQYLKTGEDVKFIAGARPSVQAQWYYLHLISKICNGTGISSQLILPQSMQGTVARGDLDVAAGFFKSKSHIAAAVVREIYDWSLSWGVRFDRSLATAPKDWNKAVIRTPRAVNVDTGRNSVAMIDELEAGIRTMEGICGADGQDWKHVLKQKAVEAQYIQELATEMGVSPDKIQLLQKQAPQQVKAAFKEEFKDLSQPIV